MISSYPLAVSASGILVAISASTLTAMAVATGGIATMTIFAGPGANQIYRSGPESLAAESWLIVAGKVTRYSKSVVSTTSGSEPVPLTWAISGRVEHPVAIKGKLSVSPIDFSKNERSMIVPSDRTTPSWIVDHGEISPNDTVILFFHGPSNEPTITAIPAGNDATDRISILKDIVRIQSMSDDEQPTGWLNYLRSTRNDEARKAALRELVRLKTPWSSIAPALESLLKDSTVSADMRGFAFGIVTFAVSHEVLAAPRADAVRFLCRQFVTTHDPRLLLQYILNLKLLLRYAGQSEGRLPLEQEVIETLNKRASMGPLPPELEEQYRQIRETHPEVR